MKIIFGWDPTVEVSDWCPDAWEINSKEEDDGLYEWPAKDTKLLPVWDVVTHWVQQWGGK